MAHGALFGCVQTAEALQERAKRIYDKYGNVMMDVDVSLFLWSILADSSVHRNE